MLHRHNVPCLECGKPTPNAKEYCDAKCRSAFHNRRTKRGAILYDVAMIQASEPKAYQQHNMGARVKRLIAGWQREDEARQGRRTWTKPFEVNYSLPMGEVLTSAK